MGVTQCILTTYLFPCYASSREGRGTYAMLALCHLEDHFMSVIILPGPGKPVLSLNYACSAAQSSYTRPEYLAQ